jgi:molybdenum cofactor synthesis domain-containing protein
MRCAVLTVSTSVARHKREDTSGELLARRAEEAGADVSAMEVVPDDFGLIEDRLFHYVDEGYELVLTTGGTGLTPDDVTPEATRQVIDREVPGLGEAMRAESLRNTPMGALSRGLAGVAAGTLIVNFPGSPKAIDEVFGVVAPVLEHAVATIRGDHRH